jgi:Helix-turn-helix domain
MVQKSSLTKEESVEDRVSMSRKDLDRLEVLRDVQNKKLKQVDAARILRITDRQVRKLLRRLEQEGSSGIVSRLVGKTGNRRKCPGIKQRVLALLKEKYEGFGPTFTVEKLLQLDGVKISKETARNWMIEHHLWIPKKRRTSIHPTRARRPCFGELIQADGSPDRWFGPDLPEANATVLVDDATSMITALYFSETETLDAYFCAFEEHLNQYGRPLGIYTDYSAIFKSRKETGKTQMQKALEELKIESILANSPQAKGRVERANRTLQDRLKKEFRLRGIKTVEQANKYVKEFLKEYNRSFSKKPMSDYNAHRSLEGYDLERILCRKEERTLDCSGVFQFNSMHYQVQEISVVHRLNKKKIEVRVVRSGKMRVFFEGKEVKVLPLNEIAGGPKILTRKEVLSWEPRVHKPKSDHPWRNSCLKTR